MTPEQIISEIRKELAINDRLSKLLAEYATHFANSALRVSYKVNDAAMLIRQSGMAEGAEQFVKEITKPPTAASK